MAASAGALVVAAMVVAAVVTGAPAAFSIPCVEAHFSCYKVTMDHQHWYPEPKKRRRSGLIEPRDQSQMKRKTAVATPQKRPDAPAMAAPSRRLCCSASSGPSQRRWLQQPLGGAAAQQAVARASAVSRCGLVNARLTPRWRPVQAPSAAAAREGARRLSQRAPFIYI